MLEALKKLFGNKHERQIKKYWPIVEQINRYAAEYQSLTDDERLDK